MEATSQQFDNLKTNSSSSLLMPSLSDYMDYRKFLTDFYAYKKDQTKNHLRSYNYAHFSAAADIKSPNYLKMIIEGKRNLSDDMVLKFARAVGLAKEQSEELRLLVNFNQAEDPGDRNFALKRLSEFRVEQKLKVGDIDRKAWDKVPNWIAWVLYALLDQDAVRFDIPTLKVLLRNKASEHEIQNALDILVSSGEIIKDEATGSFKKTRGMIETNEEIPVALVRKLQSQLMYLGLESLYQDAPTEREFGSLTLSLTRKEFEELKFKLRQMRKSTHKDNTIARMNSKGERVYQLNVQLYPVSDSAKNNSEIE